MRVYTWHIWAGQARRHRRRRRRGCRGGDTVYGLGGSRQGLPGRAEASAGASVAVFNPLAPPLVPPRRRRRSCRHSCRLRRQRRVGTGVVIATTATFATTAAGGGRGGGRWTATPESLDSAKLPALSLCNSSNIIAQFRFISAKQAVLVARIWSCGGNPALRLCNSSVSVHVGGWGRLRFSCSHAWRLRNKMTSVNCAMPRLSAIGISARSSGSRCLKSNLSDRSIHPGGGHLRSFLMADAACQIGFS